MEKQLFAVAAVDSHGKHTFIKRDWISNNLITSLNPTDSIYIGSQLDIDRFIDECKTTIAVNESVNYIPYTVQSNVTHLDFIDVHGNHGGTYTVH